LPKTNLQLSDFDLRLGRTLHGQIQMQVIAPLLGSALRYGNALHVYVSPSFSTELHVHSCAFAMVPTTDLRCSVCASKDGSLAK
jgi:hypothetical protein